LGRKKAARKPIRKPARRRACVRCEAKDEQIARLEKFVRDTLSMVLGPEKAAQRAMAELLDAEPEELVEEIDDAVREQGGHPLRDVLSAVRSVYNRRLTPQSLPPWHPLLSEAHGSATTKDAIAGEKPAARKH
jgi:hypothetical protein